MRNIAFLDRPLDFGKSISGKRVLGDNKTIRGFVFAVILGTLFFYIQTILYSNIFFRSISLVDYQNISLVLGFLLSFGAMVGDAIVSFLKRRMNIPSGKPWILFDQLDFVFGSVLLSSIIFLPDMKLVIIIFVMSFVLTMVFHYLGYIVGINKDKI